MRFNCDFMGFIGIIIKLLKMAIEIVVLPNNSMVMFHSYVNVYQRVFSVLPKDFQVFSPSPPILTNHGTTAAPA